MAGKVFEQAQLEAIADALGDTEAGLEGSEIALLLKTAKISDPGEMTKRKRLYIAFAGDQNKRQDRRHVLEFIRVSMRPARYVRKPGRYEPMRMNLNRALSFSGLEVTEAGLLRAAEQVGTLGEAERRARSLRRDLEGRNVHPDVLRFCNAELLADNYFHAVQEAAKSVADKIRSRTGLKDDGGGLVDRTLCGAPPMLAINSLATPSEISEQKGFANLVKGVFGMFRNPTAHEARVKWEITKEDAEDLLTMVSLIHRRLDGSHMPIRAAL